jgi:hypothetical protein
MQSGFSTLVYGFYIDVRPVIRGFFPLLGDIGPFLRPNLGRKLGYGYQLQAYIN